MEEREESKLSGGELLPEPCEYMPPSVVLKSNANGTSENERKNLRKRKSARFLGYIVVSATLIIAFVLTVIALGVAPSSVEEEEIEASETDDSAQKVIYVQKYGSSDGALSTPELYSLCAESVVSIAVKSGKGDSAYFDSRQPHGMRALNGKCAKILVITI